MTEVQPLEALRVEIDAIDREMVRLFEARMEIAGKIADAKREINKSIYDEGRENQVLEKNADRLVHQEWREELQAVYRELMKQSRAIQKRRMAES